MYINPVLAGVLGTILVEVAACIVCAIWNDRKK